MTTTTTNLEARAIGREMATARHRLTDYYRTSNNLTAEEAEAQVTDLIEQETSDQLLQRPPGDLTWCDLDRLAKQTPALAMEAWENIKDHVREEFRTAVGHPGPWRPTTPTLTRWPSFSRSERDSSSSIDRATAPSAHWLT